jgi:peptidoglycan/xylan/chitin deacetylase (PgdA/CDA1 family)
LDRELRVARDRLSGILRTKVDEAAVPFGSYDRRVIRALKSHGYRLAYTSDRGRAPNGWIVPRETWVSGWGRARLQQLADDHPSTIQHASRRLIRLVKRLR